MRVRRRLRRRRHGEPLLAPALDGTEVGERRAGVGGEDVHGVLRPAPAGRGEEGVGGEPLEEEDLPGRGAHGLARERLLGARAAVDLAAGRRAEVVTLRGEVAAPLHGVGPRRHGLRLLRFQLVVDARPELERHDAEEVLLEADPVHDVDRVARGRHDEDVPPVAGVVHREEGAVRGLELHRRRRLARPLRPLDEERPGRGAGRGEAHEECVGDGVAPHPCQERLDGRPRAGLAEPHAPAPPRLRHGGGEGEEGAEAERLGLGRVLPGEGARLDLVGGDRASGGRRPDRQGAEDPPHRPSLADEPVPGGEGVRRPVDRHADVQPRLGDLAEDRGRHGRGRRRCGGRSRDRRGGGREPRHRDRLRPAGRSDGRREEGGREAGSAPDRISRRPSHGAFGGSPRRRSGRAGSSPRGGSGPAPRRASRASPRRGPPARPRSSSSGS